MAGWTISATWLVPGPPCDFKLTIDLATKRATAWTSRRGDDRWFLLLDEAPVDPRVTAIGAVRVVQHPAAPGITDFVVQNELWPGGEIVRPHPLAKRNRVVIRGTYVNAAELPPPPARK